MSEFNVLFAVKSQASSLIQRLTTSTALLDGETAVVVDPTVNDETHYFADAETLALRPSMGLPREHTMAAGEVWELPEAPEGTVLVIDGEAEGEADDDGLSVSFTMPATYYLDFQCPEPWLGGSCVVTVTP